MNGKRPTVLTVFGVLNIIFGSLGLMCNLCAGSALFGGMAILKAAADQGDPKVTEAKEALEKLFSIPGLLPFFVVALVGGVILGAVLLSAGIGLLKARPWGRTLSIVYSIAVILLQVGSFAFNIAILEPEMEKIVQQNPQFKDENPLGSAVGSVVGAAFAIGYAVILLIFMMTPTVTDALKPRSARGYDEYDRDQEMDDYDRRRRDDAT